MREGAASNPALGSLLLSECARRNDTEQEGRACENSVKTGARGLCHRTLKPFEPISDLHWDPSGLDQVTVTASFVIWTCPKGQLFSRRQPAGCPARRPRLPAAGRRVGVLNLPQGVALVTTRSGRLRVILFFSPLATYHSPPPRRSILITETALGWARFLLLWH